MTSRPLLVVVLTWLGIVGGFLQYRSLIPHGHSVRHPCDGRTIWPGVGHENPHGGGARNPFGVDFAVFNYTWSLALCRKDSDGDGSYNGLELGDINCTWSYGDTTTFLQPVRGHPGVCEPITSLQCSGSRGWLDCDTEALP